MGVRIRLWLLLIYLILPTDLIPDFIPVLGYADDAIIVAIAIRSIARTAGTSALTATRNSAPSSRTTAPVDEKPAP